MTGPKTKVAFSKNKRTKRIRKTIVFDPRNDAFVLNYINSRVEAGESFSSVVKELLLQQICLIELAPAYMRGRNTPLTDCHTTYMTPEPVENAETTESPFAELFAQTE